MLEAISHIPGENPLDQHGSVIRFAALFHYPVHGNDQVALSWDILRKQWHGWECTLGKQKLAKMMICACRDPGCS